MNKHDVRCLFCGRFVALKDFVLCKVKSTYDPAAWKWVGRGDDIEYFHTKCAKEKWPDE